MKDLLFLKLGGSLITDKYAHSSPHLEVLVRLAGEIASAWKNQRPALVLGHGSGSYGHVPAAKYGTRKGVSTPEEWLGFVEVWREARALNQIVVDSLAEVGLPAIAMPPSSAVTADDGQVHTWDTSLLKAALTAGLLPVINGDTIFDVTRGGTILSTEDLFVHLAKVLRPRAILLAGIEEGVWADYPACTQLVKDITPTTYVQIAGALGGSAATDVTGGMLEKVRTMLSLVLNQPDLTISIFSGQRPGAVASALAGNLTGTLIHS